MAEGQTGERTEKATPRRRQEARKKGQVARSNELNGTILLLVGMSVLLLSAGHFRRLLAQNSAYLFSQAHVLRADNLFGIQEILVENLELMGKVLAPLAGAILIAGVAANVMQVGFHVSTQAMAFKLEKINPLKGMKRFFQKKTFFELGKNVLKIGLIGLLSYAAITSVLSQLTAAPLLSLPAIVAMGKVSFIKLMATLLGFMVLLAVMDWTFQKHQHEQSLKMTKTELKKELKDIDGDPQLKARIRGIQLEMARKRMLADVPTADVVVTNPTHYAVALKYKPGDPAPKVVAKGKDQLAEKIKKIARRSRVPVIENKPVARALYKTAKIGQLVPESLYQTVAEILAYVYRLRSA